MKKFAFAAMAAFAVIAPSGTDTLGATSPSSSSIQCYGPTCWLITCTTPTDCKIIVIPNPEFPQAPDPE